MAHMCATIWNALTMESWDMRSLYVAIVGCVALTSLFGCQTNAPKKAGYVTEQKTTDFGAASKFAVRLHTPDGTAETQFVGKVTKIIHKSESSETVYEFDQNGRPVSESGDDGLTHSYFYKGSQLTGIKVTDGKSNYKDFCNFTYNVNGELIQTRCDDRSSSNYSYEKSGLYQRVIIGAQGTPPIVWDINPRTGEPVGRSMRPTMISVNPQNPRVYTSSSVEVTDFLCSELQPNFLEKCTEVKAIEGKRQVTRIKIRDKNKLPVSEYLDLGNGTYGTTDIEYHFDANGNWIRRDLAYGSAPILGNREPGKKSITRKTTEHRTISYY